ncbi:hypothetical protein [Streptomyces sp. enrichment culture]|uniref:hypothetical protein n=1 Tax=Streptomyces sp. enrichment culture TaxID=1795815 RepID=UPI003F54E91B
MHEQTPYAITTPAPYAPPRTPAERPVILPTEVPPGVEWVTLPNGVRTLAYTHASPQPQIPVTAPQPIPAWAKTTALLTPTIGGGIAAAGIGLSYAAPGLIAMSHALWATVALIAAGTLALPLLLRTTRGRAPAATHITQNITANGLFSRATGTINHH